ncbi:MAG: methyl-accepting chemotaxis protein [Nitrospirae bacterium]|nr:methyl-accepting chemotaxis protein [Nitrospirota bacterium]
MGYRRRNYFIKKRLQSRFIFGFSLIVVLGFLASWLFVYYTVDKRLSEELYRSHIKIETTEEIISGVLLKINLIAIPLLILSAVAVGEFIIDKVTGPIRNFKEALEDFGRADLTPKTLKDIPPELSMLYNTMVDNFSKTLRSIKRKEDELEKIIEELERIAGGKTISRQEVEDIYKSISENRNSIEKDISFFKV